MTTVLFVVSAAQKWTLKDGSAHPTGFWAEELAEPHRLFSEAGWDVTIATPGGVAPTVDDLSLGLMGGLPAKRAAVADYLEQISAQLSTPEALDCVNEADFDLVFYPGGHGPMEDLAVDDVSGRLLRNRVEAGRPLALLCHAPAAVLAAVDDGGDNAFAGRKLTGLSNVEEKANTFAWKAKWLLEDELKKVGIDYEKGLIPFRPHIVVDQQLYSGQNPQSSVVLAERLIKDLS